jgi:hypothetical protein
MIMAGFIGYLAPNIPFCLVQKIDIWEDASFTASKYE